MPKKASPSQRDRLHLLDQFKPGTPSATMAVDLLQMMIQVDTSNPPGNEIELAKKLEEWVQAQGFNLVTTRIFESEPGRASLIVDIPGTEPETHPSYGFMSHLDVVPAEGTWTHPPFAAKIVEAEHDSFIWGRGAMDIKYMGAAHLTAAFTLLGEGFRPKGNIKILLCADEECGGHKGLDWLARNHPDAIKVDCCLNEGGGFKIPLKDDFVIQTGEKGIFWTKFKIHGKGGHGSMPPPHDTTAIYKMVAVLEHLKKYKPKMSINKEYISTIDAMSIPGAFKFLLKRKSLLRGLLNFVGRFAKVNLAQVVIPLVSDSIAVTNFHSGMKENSISPDAEIILDIRTLPGHDRNHVNAMIRKVIGADLFDQMEWEARDNQMCTTSTMDNEYYKIIENITREIYPGANLVPMLSAGSTDSKFYRERGMHAYGFCPAIKDDDMTYNELLSLAHNANERISITNLLLGVDFNYRVMKQC